MDWVTEEDISPNGPDRFKSLSRFPLSGNQRRIFTGINRSVCHDDQSPPSSAWVKNKWSCTSVPFVCFLGLQTDNFTFILINRVWDYESVYGQVNCICDHGTGLWFHGEVLRSMIYQPLNRELQYSKSAPVHDTKTYGGAELYPHAFYPRNYMEISVKLTQRPLHFQEKNPG